MVGFINKRNQHLVHNVIHSALSTHVSYPAGIVDETRTLFRPILNLVVSGHSKPSVLASNSIRESQASIIINLHNKSQ